MFGVNSSFGLPEPVLMNNVTTHVEHITNSTYGHHGEMGLPVFRSGPSQHLRPVAAAAAAAAPVTRGFRLCPQTNLELSGGARSF
eukprot:COSAG04_NODE_3920_length_2421_cov_2.208010_1_plen_85_part_00